MAHVIEKTALDQQVEDILKKYDLDFEIKKLPMVGILTLDNGNGIKEVPSDIFGIYNTKTEKIIGNGKEGYTISQNSEIVELALRGIEGFGELSVQKAGSLHDGKRVFIQLKVSGFAKVGNDKIEKYITLIDSNDGSTRLAVGIGDLTMSCMNQFYKFYKGSEMKLSHTPSMTEKLKMIPTLIKTALEKSMRTIEIYNEFQSTPITRDLADRMVNHLLGFDRVFTPAEALEAKTPKSINNMNDLYNHIDKEIKGKGLNLWGLHSGVTSWNTHKKQTFKRESGKLEMLLSGKSYTFNQKSFEYCANVANIEID